MTATREIVVYLPAGGHPATEGIARGSAIVGVPEPGTEEVRIYSEDSLYGQSNMITLADRALVAYERLRDRAPTVTMRVVPRGALVTVGTFDEAAGRIILTGDQSAAAVATWLGVPTLDPAELRRSTPPQMDAAELAARLAPDIRADVNRGLAAALIRRAGFRREGGEWIAPDDRRTSADAEALNWALVAIAAGETG
ncbi:MAG: hypothetical protein J0H06_14900 [Actinobacteria bacterium]|nr:hypothetical protein [Actinomycetota bacterium]OJU82761.1 MAG: hypothetical protein BGO11_09465 [Solirubrobacterales bacterium 70-9]